MFACPLFREFREPNKTAKLKGANINCRPKIGRNYYSISNYMVLICQNERGQNNFACKVANFYGSQIKGFYSNNGINSEKSLSWSSKSMTAYYSIVSCQLLLTVMCCIDADLLSKCNYTVNQKKNTKMFTQHRSLAKSVGCFQQRLFVCVCLSTR